ncbi:MAG: fibronectin type III domain-containing protein [Actinomycetota bacterium]|nr:fibronectin type III domain-containing protein [Actinomycetota bacterium]
MPVYSHLTHKLREERAFGLVEALMALVIMSLVLVALLGLLTVSVKAVAGSKLSTLANQLLNESIEEMRSVPYDSVVPGTTEETRTVLGYDLGVRTEISWVDDAADLTGPDDTNNNPNDYKQVVITVSWLESDGLKSLSAATFVRSTPNKTQPPTVNFVIGENDYNATPPSGTVFGLDAGYALYNELYEQWLNNGTIPLKATGTDPDADLLSMRFIVSGITPADGLYGFDPIASYTNSPICRWPRIEDAEFWPEGAHEVVVEVWDAQGGRDAKSMFWYIDRLCPYWEALEPANLAATALSQSAIQLSWQKAWDGNEQVNRYRIYRKAPGEGSFSMLVPDYNNSTPNHQDQGLLEWQTYSYYISALSVGGRESTTTSSIASATTWFSITGEPVKEQGKRKVIISWNPSAWSPLGGPPLGVTIHRYDIYRNGTMIGYAVGNLTSYKDDNNGEGLAKTTPYDYKVRAIDNSGQEINQSTSISVITGN